MFFREFGLYFGDPELLNLAARLWKWVGKWQAEKDIMHMDFLDVIWAQTYDDDPAWITTPRAFFEVEIWPALHSLDMSPYKSHLTTTATRWAYLREIWPNSPYLWAIKAIYQLWRKGEAAIPTAHSLLSDNQWDGFGVSAPVKLGHVENIGPVEIDATVTVESSAYKGDQFSAFFLASVLLYYYADKFGYTTEKNDAKVWADEAADMALKLQIPWTGRQLSSEQDGQEIYVPQEAGGIIGAYDVNDNGEPITKSWQPWQQEVVEWFLGLTGVWTKPNKPWPGAGSTAFESTLATLKALQMYKAVILKDFT